MKLIGLILSILIIKTSYSQHSYLVVANVKKLFTSHLLFNKYTDNCGLDFSSAIEERNERVFIIGDTLCRDSLNKCFLVIFDTTGYWIEKIIVENYDSVEIKLNVIKNKTPDLKKRYLLASNEYHKIIMEKINKEIKEIDSLHNQFEKYLNVLRTKNIVLMSWSWSYPNEYSSFTDVTIEVINPYKQKIKYIWFTFKATNAVNDPVRDGITGATSKTVQGIGPIEYGGTGVYNFESVFYSKVIETMRMTQIKIQFFDGSLKIINTPLSLNRE